MGVRSILPPDLQKATRAPTSTDKAYVKGTLWLDTSNAVSYMYNSAGSWIQLGTNGSAMRGTAVLSSGTRTVTSTEVQAGSIIRMTRQSIGSTGAAALGFLTITTITPGVSFVITAVQPADATAAQTTDVSEISWEIVN